MQPEFIPGSEEERLEVENKCLRMKLMLENGAEFSAHAPRSEFPLEVENAFLNHIIEFENQFRKHKLISVRERIGNPPAFKSESEMNDEEVKEAWDKVDELLARNDINLSACSPNISPRDLYSFATGEFLDIEMDDIRMPGMMNCFIYDEFYPDPLYECETTARDGVMRSIFNKDPMANTYDFSENGILLNDEQLANREELFSRLNRFKDLFEDIEIAELLCNKSEVMERKGIVTGTYIMQTNLQSEQFRIAGSWEIQLENNAEFNYWIATAITIRGIDFI